MSSTTIDTQRPLTSLPFPPVTPAHILNCSFHSWYPCFRSLTPKSRLIPLSQPFLDYLRADGILLPPEHGPNDADSGFEDGFQNDDEEDEDPSEQWTDIHAKIRSTISELGGKVMPKLNWSAPKDATWIATTNDMECRTPNDVYLLLKSSDFITHDLEHAFDGCTIAEDSKDCEPGTEIHNGNVQGDSKEKAFPEVPYHLVLRKAFNLNPSLEFRCFIRERKLIAISQREMNHFDFLFDLRDAFKKLIQEFLELYLLSGSGGKGFPDENFVVDVYIPPPHDRVWLIDINPWAPRTDPLLFSWLELLQLPSSGALGPNLKIGEGLDGANREAEVDEGEEEGDLVFDPEFRLVKRDDPEAYQFSATKYSAHKLPKEVVDASMAPGDMKNMMEEWRKVIDKQVEEDEDSDSDSGNT